MSNSLENFGEFARDNWPKKKASVYLDKNIIANGLAQVLPDCVIFYPSTPTNLPDINRQPVCLKTPDTSAHIFLQINSDAEQTESKWHFLYL